MSAVSPVVYSLEDIPVRITELVEDDEGQFLRNCLLESMSSVYLLPEHLFIISNNRLYHTMLQDCYRHGKAESSISIGVFHDSEDRKPDTLDFHLLKT